MRTTSSLESFNSKLNRSIAKKSNYYRFFERLRIHESRSADRMHNLSTDLLPDTHFDPKHKYYQERAIKIKANTSLLCKGKMTVAEFLYEMTVDEDEYDDSSSSDGSSDESSEYSESSDEDE